MIAATYVLTLHTHYKVGPEEGLIEEQLLRETEENLTDLLPLGWWVRIREWNEQREGDDDD